MNTGKQSSFITNLLCLFIVLSGTATTSEESEIVPTLPPYNCQLWNAALGKPADQTNVLKNYTPDLAVDGNRDPVIEHGSCFHVKGYALNNWWMVDLMDVYLVHQIVLTNRVSHHTRINSTSIDLYVTDPKLSPGFPSNTDGAQCQFVSSSFYRTKTFDCATPTYARYVKVLKTNQDYLHLCEVEVMVSKNEKSFDVYKNSTFETGYVAYYNTITKQALLCVEMCRKEGFRCNGCLWSHVTGECQILRVEPGDSHSKIVSNLGTDFYAETPINCTRNGAWT